MKSIAYIGIALCMIGCTRNINSNDSSKGQYMNYKDTKKLMSIIWDADTLIKNRNTDKKDYKSLYEIMLPDSAINKKFLMLDRYSLENEILDLKIARLKEYDRFEKTKYPQYALKVIAYSQYLATRFPGVDGKEIRISANIIDKVSKELRDLNLKTH